MPLSNFDLFFPKAFCCVGALAIANRLDVRPLPTNPFDLPMMLIFQVVDPDQLGWWLAERQVSNGGLNGRPEKLADVLIYHYICKHLLISVEGLLFLVGGVCPVCSEASALD